MSQQSLIVLGAGYTASFLLPLACERYAQVFATSRNPDAHLSHLQPDQRVRFDLTQPDTWSLLPRKSDLLWCFPAMPLDLVQKFAEAASLSTRRVVVLGSTSAYDVGSSTAYPPPWCDETAPIDLSKPRVQGEEYLRSHYGARILRVVGIYGPHRNPIDWIRTGRVRPSRKYVNLIHVEDLARVCLAACMRAKAGEIYNVADGTPRTWNEICDSAGIARPLESSQPEDSTLVGKRITNQRMMELLASDQTCLHYPDILDAVLKIQQRPAPR